VTAGARAAFRSEPLTPTPVLKPQVTPPMSKLTQTQTGAFFGILASVLIFVLTAMALASMNSLPRHHSHISTAALTQDNQAPTGLIG